MSWLKRRKVMNTNKQGRFSSISRVDIKRKSNYILEKVIRLFFRKIDFDDESLLNLNEYIGKGKAVYVSFQSSNTSLLLLLNILRKHNFDVPEFALDFAPDFLQSVSGFFNSILRFLLKIFSKKKDEAASDFEFIKNGLNNDKPLVLSLLSRKLFLRRYLEIKSDSLQYLIEVQKTIDEPIYLFPQIMFWNQNPERTRTLLATRATVDRGPITGFFTYLKSSTPTFLRVTVPINLQEEISGSSTGDAKQIARKLRNNLLEIYNSEKRAILGPVIKSQQEMMEKVLYHKNVLDEIETLVAEEKISEKKLRKKSYKYFKEIAADFSILYLRWLNRACVYLFNRIFNGINYSQEDLKMVREASKKGPLIIVPSHKSHMDYLIISSTFYINKIIPPHIASGANLLFFPMGKIFRKSGAFFMRRTFKGFRPYGVIFRQYVKTLISEGYSIEFFIEGTRTRTGRLSAPKMGTLKYLIEAIEEGYNKDMIFLPTTINYDRILEESSYHTELKGKKKESESTSAFVNSRKLLKRKYGRVYLSFNEPVSYNELREKFGGTEDITSKVGEYITKRINEIQMVTPFSISTATILLSSAKGFSKEMLKEKITVLDNYLEFAGAKISEVLQDESNLDEIIDYVLESYEEDNIVRKLESDFEKDKGEIALEGYYVLNEDERVRINLYKNSIIHFFLPVTFISVLLLNSSGKEGISDSKLKEGFAGLMDFFSGEFTYPETMDDIDDVIEKNLSYLEKVSAITREEGQIKVNIEDDLVLYAKMVQEILESYLVVFDSIVQIKKKLSKKSLIYEIRKNGIKLYHMGSIKLPEALSSPNYNSALSKFNESGLLEMTQISRKNVEVEINDTGSAEKMKSKLERYLEKIQ